MGAAQTNVYIGDPSQIADAVITAVKIAAGVIPTGSLTLVERKDITVETSQIDFSSIGTHRTYILFIDLRVNTKADKLLNFYLNDDFTDTNYTADELVDASVTTYNFPYLGNTKNVCANITGQFIISRVATESINVIPCCVETYSNGTRRIINGIKWINAADITKITIREKDNTAKVIGKACLYYISDMD